MKKYFDPDGEFFSSRWKFFSIGMTLCICREENIAEAKELQNKMKGCPECRQPFCIKS